jgi:hypothetical protein
MNLANNKHVSTLEALIKEDNRLLLAQWLGYADDIEERVDKVMLFAQTFLPNYCTVPFAPFHRDLIRRYFSDQNEFVACPRGFAKTSILQISTIYSILYKLDKFIVIIEKTFTEASEVLKGIRDEFEENELLLLVYGKKINYDMEKAQQSSKNPDARGDVMINGVRIRGRGFETPPRGMKSGASRPTRILMDDVESDEHIDNSQQRQKYEDTYISAVVPAPSKKGTIKMYGTILHRDSLLNNQIRMHGGSIYKAFYTPELDKEYNVLELEEVGIGTHERTGFANEKAKLLWPEYWGWGGLMEKRGQMMQEYATSNKFFQEYRNEPLAEEERAFKADWLWNKEREIGLEELMRTGKNFVIHAKIDCAHTVAEKADWTACVVHMIDSERNWYRVEVFRARLDMPEQIQLIFDVWSRWEKYGAMRIGVERLGFNDQMKPFIDAEMDLRGVYPSLVELRPMGNGRFRTSKEERIKGALQLPYKRGKIWTVLDESGKPVGKTEELKEELYHLGKSKTDDLADAEAYEADMQEEVWSKEESRRNEGWSEPIDDPYYYGSTIGDFAIVGDDPYA